MDLLKKIQDSSDYILKKSNHSPEIGLILGSGLGSLVDLIENAEFFPYEGITKLSCVYC